MYTLDDVEKCEIFVDIFLYTDIKNIQRTQRVVVCFLSVPDRLRKPVSTIIITLKDCVPVLLQLADNICCYEIVNNSNFNLPQIFESNHCNTRILQNP